jgi:tight adherence protein C
MIYLVVALVAVSVALLVVGVGGLVTGQGRVVRQRLAEVRTGDVSREADARRRRQERRESLQGILEVLGSKVSTQGGRRTQGVRKQLVEAGYRSPNAVVTYMAVRILSLLALLGVGMLLATLMPPDPLLRLLVMLGLALLGWMVPFMILKRKVNFRKKELNRGLADALDLMVVCVEAGLGVNQALLRVAEEMDRVCPPISDELTMVTLEMRAGTPRDQALKSLAERTGNEDIRSWVNMMIQTDRFGTSIADSLRIHSDTLRTKRHQRAEEAASKLTVKMLIPLVLFIFPAIFIVILGPAVLAMRELFGAM